MNALFFTVPFRNFQAFNTALRGSAPLFQVDVILSAPKIVLQPCRDDIYRLIMQCVRECVESTKVGKSWKDLKSKRGHVDKFTHCFFFFLAHCTLDARDLH